MGKNSIDKEIVEQKLAYIGLNLERPNKVLNSNFKMDFKIVSSYDENKYKQYRYVNIADIKIILSQTNRLDELSKKLKNAKEIETYLDYKNERNIEEHAKFLEMISNVTEEDIQEVEEEQKALNKNVPFNVKFTGNYLWQIYYFENINEYVMIVPTEETDNSRFFYILKEKIKNRPNAQVYIPIRNIDYSNKFIKKTTFEEMENFMWIFTKDWASIYEVYDKTGNMEINIIGETFVYPMIKSMYKIVLKSKEDTIKFYKLMKALYILQTELPDYYKFDTKINSEGGLDIYFKGRKLEYKIIGRWISREYLIAKKKMKELKKLRIAKEDKLKNLKEIYVMQEAEYIAKEKKISTYLECKKTVIGKIKYFFKYSRIDNKRKDNKKDKDKKHEEVNIKTNSSLNTKLNQDTISISQENRRESFTLDELLNIYEEYYVVEKEFKNLMMDINSIKLKNKNTKKKIENATSFIEEIDKHKRSIFEFWKYTNKDELAVLPESEIEEPKIEQSIKKIFDFDEEFERFGIEMDKLQRKLLTKRELDNIYVTTTSELGVVNDIKLNRISPKDLEIKLRNIKKEYLNSLKFNDEEEIFGSKTDTKDKISKIGNKRHREIPKNLYSILDIGKNANKTGYKLAIEQVIYDVNLALDKIKIQEEICGYIACLGREFDKKQFNVMNLNISEEAKKLFEADTDNNKLCKVRLKKGTSVVAFTNSIFFDNKNKTLPIGQDISNKIIVDLSKEKIELVKEEKVRIVALEQDTTLIKTINILEYEMI